MSIQPGVQQHCEIEGARGISLRTGTVGSVTQDGMTPVEYGRVAAASKYTTTASSGDPLVPELVKLVLLQLSPLLELSPLKVTAL